MTTVSVSVHHQVMTITLEGEDTLNSLTPETIQGLNHALDQAEKDNSLRAVVVTGSGERAFSVGMDITFLGQCFDDPPGTFLPFLRSYHQTLNRLERLPVPVIAQVNGLARAGGFELILACDLVIVADEAKVGDIHVNFGVPPGAGASQRAPRKLGDQKAKALLLTPKWLYGPEMVQWGLAIQSVPRAKLGHAVEGYLSSLRGSSRVALAITKSEIHAAQHLELEQGLELELEYSARFHAEVRDAREGYAAFVERRQPCWGDDDVKSW